MSKKALRGCLLITIIMIIPSSSTLDTHIIRLKIKEKIIIKIHINVFKIFIDNEVYLG